MTDTEASKTGKRVRKYRKDSHLTQKELADKTGLSGNTVARLERGRHVPTTDTLKKIAKFFDVKIDDLVGN